MLALIHAAQRIERAGAQPRYFAHLLKQRLGPIENTGAKVILRQSKQRLLPMFRGQFLAREEILMNSDGALYLAAPPIQCAQRKMRLDGLRIGIHQLQKHIERPVGLLGDQVIKSRQIVGMQFAQR